MKNNLVKLAFATCKPMDTNDSTLYLCLIYDLKRDYKDCKNDVEEQICSKGYLPVEFNELPPIPYTTACALARDNENYLNGRTVVDLEVIFKYGLMTMRDYVSNN